MTTEARKEKQRKKRRLKRLWRKVDKVLKLTGKDDCSSQFIASHSSPKQGKVVTAWSRTASGCELMQPSKGRKKVKPKNAWGCILPEGSKVDDNLEQQKEEYRLRKELEQVK